MEKSAIFKMCAGLSAKAEKTGGQVYTLPSWRVREIILLALETLSTQEYYNADFDYKKMITGMGIKLKKFSMFSPKNLQAFRSISLSLWDEGVCAVFPNPENGEQRRMIAYDDTQGTYECMQTILHELGHLLMQHTQQSLNGEMEANCFSTAMTLFITLERRFHIGRNVVRKKGKHFLPQSIRKAMQKKEAM